MRVVCISDSHLYHEDRGSPQLEIPPGDLLIHAGDGTFEGSIREVKSWLSWLESLPHANKVFIAGNHDWLFQKNPTLARSMVPKNLVYLEDDMREVAGLKIYGAPWTPFFLNWAFNLERGHRLREKWNKIPREIDILVTHGPPQGVLDLTYHGEHVGCADLADVVQRIKPKLHVFGHIHQSGPNVVVKGVPATTFVNAAVLDEAYGPTKKPIIVVDL